METSSLKHLLTPAPTCVLTDSLAALALLFGHSDRQMVVIVNENQHPVGVITLNRLLPYLLIYNPPHQSSEPWQQPLIQTLLPAIEPINSIPIDWDIPRLQEYLQTCSPIPMGTPYALVRADGTFLGLLDSYQLFQHLFISPTPDPYPTATSVYPDWPACQILLAKAGASINFEQPPTLNPQSVDISYPPSAWQPEPISPPPSQLPWTEDFLASISHELKTPLTALLGLSALLKDELSQTASVRQAKYARLIHQSGRQLMVLVNDLVDWTRLERGEIELLLQSIDIETICRQSWEQVKETFYTHNCEETSMSTGGNNNFYQPNTDPIADRDLAHLLPNFEIEIESGLDSIIADELRLRQMLVNLITSALSVTDAYGKVGLQVSYWHPQWIGFTVWDTGTTIRPADQPFMGQRFQSRESISEPLYDRLLTQNLDHTGLSFMLTQQLAKLHRGDITFTSCQGQGNQFTILLPSSATLAQTETAPQPTPSSISTLHPDPLPALALIGETDPDRIVELTKLLTPLNHQVIVARSRQEILIKTRQFQPSVILLNVTLPQLMGPELLKQLKTDAATRHLQAIAFYVDSEGLALDTLPLHDLLSYPIHPLTLQQKLNLHRPAPKPLSPPPRLTILCLTPGSGSLVEADHQAHQSSSIYLSALPAQKHRIVEASDLDQAELLARIWKPDLLLIDESELNDPLTFLEDLRQRCLAVLPLVTLTPEITQAANQLSGLTVFPCLAPSDPLKLLQVIQVAAGFNR